jgi:hypothetical protein
MVLIDGHGPQTAALDFFCRFSWQFSNIFHRSVYVTGEISVLGLFFRVSYAVPILLVLWFCVIWGFHVVLMLFALHLLFQNSPINCAVLTGNGNVFNSRWRLNTTACPVPQSQAESQRFTLFLTHLSFRWTLPLKGNMKIAHFLYIWTSVLCIHQ